MPVTDSSATTAVNHGILTKKAGGTIVIGTSQSFEAYFLTPEPIEETGLLKRSVLKY